MAEVMMVQGLGFGDEGKGTCVDAICRQEKIDLVVRFGGGAQCGHNVVLPDGRHHCFSQFGSGTLAGASTYLSRFVMINPRALLNEARALEALGVRDPLGLDLMIDEEALITTPLHSAMNKLHETQRGKARHGSCGMGIGETRAFALEFPELALRAKDLLDEHAAREKIGALRAHYDAKGIVFALDDETMLAPMLEVGRRVQILPQSALTNLLLLPSKIIFEGHQGVLLDQDHGVTPPHVTWSDCTFNNANALLAGAERDVQVRRLGVMRTYMTRHGAGPLPTEIFCKNGDEYNPTNPWQGAFREGLLDLPLLRYARRMIGPLDGLCVTHCDAIEDRNTLVAENGQGQRQIRTATREEFLPLIAEQLQTPIVMTSSGKTWKDKTFL